MTGAKRDNIFFLPQTMRFYEENLAEALKAEQYEQAVQMLRGMLSIHGIEASKRHEWEHLLEGIKALFPALTTDETMDWPADGDDSEDEETFRIAAMSRKMNDDPGYAERLLKQLQEGDGTENVDDQLLVLEQLAYAESGKTDTAILGWLSERRHPLLQFRALQTLKQRGVQVDVPLPRNDGTFIVSVQDVPLGDTDLPESVKTVFHMLRRQCEGKYPTLGGFLPDIERDFVAYAYGTNLYREMNGAIDPLATRMWASALHASLQRNIFHLEDVAEICREYDIPNEHLGEWQRIFFGLELLFAEMFEGRV